MKFISLVTFALSALLSLGTTTPAAWLAPDPHQALTGLPDAGGWRAAVASTAPGTPAPDPAAAPVEQVRRFVAGLSASQREALARRAPGVVGNLDGAPYHLRYDANERAHATAIATAAAGAGGPRPAGRLLGYDPRGDGRLILVFGELAVARHVAVIVPGSGWRLDSILEHTGPEGADPVESADALRRETRRLDPIARVAVVVWLGYDAPEDIDRQAMRSDRAVEGARSL